ncbi:hypothetical protein HK105_206360 [Polyrhizophydium stewartii]|uniref:Transcription factor domain-containing protein n=1 Tax=Polyrhizophydium stewartii TaxID=2732419 RepID=A0ABR4N3K1_9FUNG
MAIYAQASFSRFNPRYDHIRGVRNWLHFAKTLATMNTDKPTLSDVHALCAVAFVLMGVGKPKVLSVLDMVLRMAHKLVIDIEANPESVSVEDHESALRLWFRISEFDRYATFVSDMPPSASIALRPTKRLPASLKFPGEFSRIPPPDDVVAARRRPDLAPDPDNMYHKQLELMAIFDAVREFNRTRLGGVAPPSGGDTERAETYAELDRRLAAFPATLPLWVQSMPDIGVADVPASACEQLPLPRESGRIDISTVVDQHHDQRVTEIETAGASAGGETANTAAEDGSGADHEEMGRGDAGTVIQSAAWHTGASVVLLHALVRIMLDAPMLLDELRNPDAAADPYSVVETPAFAGCVEAMWFVVATIDRLYDGLQFAPLAPSAGLAPASAGTSSSASSSPNPADWSAAAGGAAPGSSAAASVKPNLAYIDPWMHVVVYHSALVVLLMLQIPCAGVPDDASDSMSDDMSEASLDSDFGVGERAAGSGALGSLAAVACRDRRSKKKPVVPPDVHPMPESFAGSADPSGAADGDEGDLPLWHDTTRLWALYDVHVSTMRRLATRWAPAASDLNNLERLRAEHVRCQWDGRMLQVLERAVGRRLD